MVTTIEGMRKRVTMKPLKAPAARPTDRPMHDEHGVRRAGGRRGAHGGRGDGDDRGHRQVDLAGDDEERHGEGDDRLLGEIEGGVGEVRTG